MKHRKTFRITTSLVVATSLMLTACSSSDSSSGTTTEPVTPVSYTVCTGTPQEATELATPTRVVSLAPTATETIFAIGAGDALIAVDDQSNHPAEALDVANKLSGYEPNLEAIAELEPDLVIISYDPASLKKQLCALDIPVWEGNAVANLEGVYEQIRELGSVLGADEGAANTVTSMKQTISEATANVELDGASTYYYELDNTYYSITSNTFIGSILKDLFGMSSIADGVQAGNDYPQLNAEAIIAADPTVIFLADTKCCAQTSATVAARPGWSALTAVTSDRVIELDDDIASRWGPRVADLVVAIKDGLSNN